MLKFILISANCGIFTNINIGIFIAIYVNNLLIINKNLIKIKNIKTALNKRF
jgi:hypothetical protein